jgi:hypothetical protein
MQRGYDSYARKLAKLGPNGDPEQMRLMQQGMAHYQRRGAMAPPAPQPISPTGPPLMPPMPIDGGGEIFPEQSTGPINPLSKRPSMLALKGLV